ncbi:hypothetical protein J0667_08855 [Methylomonas sp. WH-1]|nr:hypothetical protein [Methylomonas sp. LW13]
MRQYLLTRLKKQNLNTSLIVKDSTPVLGFGDYYCASVATVGLNPSHREFLDSKRLLLLGPNNRLETNKTLRISDIQHALPHQLQIIECGCLQYFHKNPYKSWFDKFNPILNSFDVSYYDGTACHLDLVQSATNKNWSKLSAYEKKNLLENESWFFKEQVCNKNIKIILLNGRSVINAFISLFDKNLKEIKISEINNNCATYDSIVWNLNINCKEPDKCREFIVIGWSINIQSSYGVGSQLINDIANKCATYNTNH